MSVPSQPRVHQQHVRCTTYQGCSEDQEDTDGETRLDPLKLYTGRSLCPPHRLTERSGHHLLSGRGLRSHSSQSFTSLPHESALAHLGYLTQTERTESQALLDELIKQRQKHYYYCH